MPVTARPVHLKSSSRKHDNATLMPQIDLHTDKEDEVRGIQTPNIAKCQHGFMRIDCAEPKLQQSNISLPDLIQPLITMGGRTKVQGIRKTRGQRKKKE